MVDWCRDGNCWAGGAAGGFSLFKERIEAVLELVDMQKISVFHGIFIKPLFCLEETRGQSNRECDYDFGHKFLCGKVGYLIERQNPRDDRFSL